ncbi:4Fe-4S dicluster domain-containing protein [Porticoccaceae bacterium]|nr:4Fe-4S dicluster domain-containing protein [Porticoccaceae bacterium]
MDLMKLITSPQSPEPFEHLPFGSSWVEQTRQQIDADLLGVVAIDKNSHPDLLYGVKTFLPSAKACVILGMEYDSETINLIKHPIKYVTSPKTGELLSPHVLQLNREIDQANYDLARSLKKQGYRSIALPSRGLPMRPGQIKAALSYCHVAELAGMGTIGTHSLLITPEFGTRTRLTALLTEAPLQTTKRVDPIDDCTHCLDCVKICPVSAIAVPTLGERYKIDAMRCKFYRDKVDNCGLCQKVCSYATGHSETVGGPLRADDLFHEATSAGAHQQMWEGE